MIPSPNQVGQWRGVKKRHENGVVVVTGLVEKGKFYRPVVILSKTKTAGAMLRYAQDEGLPTLGPVT